MFNATAGLLTEHSKLGKPTNCKLIFVLPTSHTHTHARTHTQLHTQSLASCKQPKISQLKI